MIRSLALAALIGSAAVLPARAEMARYDLDPDHVVVAILVNHMGYENVLGTFADVSGHYMFDPETHELGAVEVRVGSASVDTRQDDRNGHVKSGDFLNVSEFPEITFTADGGTATSENEGTVDGTVTILGVSKPLTLHVTLNQIAVYPFGHQKEVVGISARAALKRSEFGMTYGVENGLVGDDVNLIIEAEAIRAD
jgi:polyisoprenoid-binding protein YceI